MMLTLIFNNTYDDDNLNRVKYSRRRQPNGDKIMGNWKTDHTFETGQWGAPYLILRVTNTNDYKFLGA